MNWHIKTFESLTTQELYGILNLRNEVFVVEQNCVYQDTDWVDQDSFHIFLEDDGNIVAYARAIPAHIRFENISFGRVIVSKDYRSRNLGRDLIQHTLNCIKSQMPSGDIEINGQSYLLKFYQSFGFEVIGEEFLEDGIPHFKMIKSSIK